MSEFRPFFPEDQLEAQFKINRAGRFTRGQKAAVILAALFSSGGLLCIGSMLASFVFAATQGLELRGVIGVLFGIVYFVTFLYMGLTLLINAQMFLPDVWAKEPVKQTRGKLKMQKVQRERPEMPFSYVVGDYSFAPFVVPAEIPLDLGREYVVYYAAHSRMFLGIEPLE